MLVYAAETTDALAERPIIIRGAVALDSAVSHGRVEISPCFTGIALSVNVVADTARTVCGAGFAG